MIPVKRDKIAVIGGSLGGLCAAIALRAEGFDVSVYERASGKRVDRSSGISLRPELAGFFDKYAIARPESLGIETHFRRYLERDGKIGKEFSVTQLMSSWDLIYRRLKSNFGPKRYYTGKKLLSYSSAKHQVLVSFVDGETLFCDLLVGADGAQSTVRKTLHPKVTPAYAGYVCWRGVIDFASMDKTFRALVEDGSVYYQPFGQQFLCYPVPGKTVARVNWLWYRRLDRMYLADLLVDRHGKRKRYSISPGNLRTAWITRLHEQARADLPSSLASLVGKTPAPFVQPMFDVTVPTMAAGRVALVGDSAFTLRPHTTSGAGRAALDAMTLAAHLALTPRDFPLALLHWSQSQTKEALLKVEWGKDLSAQVGLESNVSAKAS